MYVSPELVIPAAELQWRFSRSSGPGGQHVNTSDTRVELSWAIVSSAVLSGAQRDRLLAWLEAQLAGGALTVSAAEHRSQLRNREEAAAKLAKVVRAGLAPPPRRRRATKPPRGSVRRQQEAKRRRSQTKRLRRRPPLE